MNGSTRSAQSRLSDFIRRFCRNRIAVLGLAVFLLTVLACVFIPMFVRLDPLRTNLQNSFQRASAAHPLGTDALGRDLFARILYGGRSTLYITLIAVIPPAIVGSLIGMVSGYFGGRIDFYIMRIIDALSSVPNFLLVIIMECALGWGGRSFIYSLAIAGIPAFAKMLRSAVLEIIEREYIEAARALGAGHFSILTRHILHNVAPTFVVQFAASFSETLLCCTLLGYLGIGLQPPTPEWGNMFYDGQSALFAHTFPSVLPGAAIVATLMSLHFIGNGLRDAFGIQGRHT